MKTLIGVTLMNEKSAIWHPMTQHKVFGEALHVDLARDATLYLKDGRAILDGISSWWVNTHGHCHPKIVAAVQEQVAKLEQVIFAGFTHDAAEQLSLKLLSIVQNNFENCNGDDLNHVFYSDSGSTAIEVALKMAIGFHDHTGEKRSKILALDGGYHGDTFGTMAAGSRGVFNDLYAPFLFDVAHIPFPDEGHEADALDWLELYLNEHGSETAAFVFEPLVQGAAGMRIYSAAVLNKMALMCRSYGVLLIADEVMTGFGRTGTMFACEQAGVTPDLLCLSKGITGGFLPMGATLATGAIYDAFYHDEKAKQFFHSTSFTGNPMACAAALASLQIWEDEPVMARIVGIEAAHQGAAARFAARDDVVAVRTKGGIFALDVVDDVDGYLSSVGAVIYDFMLEQGVLLRPIGNTVYILPPYCITADELARIYDVLWDALDFVAAQVRVV